MYIATKSWQFHRDGSTNQITNSVISTSSKGGFLSSLYTRLKVNLKLKLKQEKIVIKLQGREDASLCACDGSTLTNAELQGKWNQS